MMETFIIAQPQPGSGPRPSLRKAGIDYRIKMHENAAWSGLYFRLVSRSQSVSPDPYLSLRVRVAFF